MVVLATAAAERPHRTSGASVKEEVGQSQSNRVASDQLTKCSTCPIDRIDDGRRPLSDLTRFQCTLFVSLGSESMINATSTLLTLKTLSRFVAFVAHDSMVSYHFRSSTCHSRFYREAKHRFVQTIDYQSSAAIASHFLTSLRINCLARLAHSKSHRSITPLSAFYHCPALSVKSCRFV
jgi:hypothetical protein